ncbi:ecto-NOX disulfide-thiol exchanger 2 isoform X2 [Aphidius gifuensis]|uniref:ecto-NOX disulfide-thiol exchanger 2 isoform X2 n=1 Tax=Aphidius gifuensis TaxID=684658 RepID=UPI001CDB9B60|nr:ecto-NOX disulfide-thiol exchanger 2 isoform X2 [Aphidius gifuensis]XP_044003932.1 ecto-NOX disulfide-thiol exchanger 2 isoform X2 [Aphidius gifuensis]
MAYNFGMSPAAMTSIGIGPLGLGPLATTHQNFIDLANQRFHAPLSTPLPLPGMNDSPLEFSTNKNQQPTVHDGSVDEPDKHQDSTHRDRDNVRRSRNDRNNDRRERDRRDDRISYRDRHNDDRRSDENNLITSSNSTRNKDVSSPTATTTTGVTNVPTMTTLDGTGNIWRMGIDYSIMGMGPMTPILSDIGLSHIGHGYGHMGMNMMSHDGTLIGAPLITPDSIVNDIAAQMMGNNLPSSSSSSSTATNHPISKELIHCKNCTLIPPSPHAPPPTTRERPPGCRTIFVGGLPENITENDIQEIFERCGEITTLRLSKKSFCHIRFASEDCVDSAIYLSGYRVRIGSGVDSANTGRLYVDYAHIYAKDDQYEWECKQRRLQRIQRHQKQFEEDRQRMQSSQRPVIHYTDYEASNICEKIKQDDTFLKAVQIVVSWLERGDCTKKNANTFYSMIQSTNSHVRRLLTEKSSYEEELQRAKELMKGRMQGLLIQFNHIERVFTAASHKKVWDHFTKAQRKNIKIWMKQSSEIKSSQLDDVLMEGEGEMEVSDSEDEPQRKKARCTNGSEDNDKVQTLEEDADSLKCQLEAYKNEVDLLKSETKAEVDAREKQIKVLQQTIKGMQEQLMASRKQQAQDDQKIKDLIFKLNGKSATDIDDNEVITLDKDDDVVTEEPKLPKLIAAVSGCVQVNQKDAKLIGLISTFLHIHPFGASVDYVWSYLQKIDSGLRPNEVENLMLRFPQVFKQELSGIGANMERRWLFSGFNTIKNNN